MWKGGDVLLQPHFEPYTVDDLFDLPPDWNTRCEVIDGCLIVAPAASPLHQVVADRICRLLNDTVPPPAMAITATAIRLPNDDGPVPDVLVSTADFRLFPRGLPATDVHTVVEVVSPGNAHHDRVRKRDLYAEAGIPCYWRVELQGWRGYRGPVPLVVVRLRESGRWRTILAPAGQEHELPVAVSRTETRSLRLDPAVLTALRAAGS